MNKLHLAILFVFIATFQACIQKPSQQKSSVTESVKKLPPVNENSFMMKMQTEALKESFRGVFSSESDEKDLFPIRSTGVSTKSIMKAAEGFIQSLSADQKARTLYDVEDDEWRMWSNVDNGIFKRQGFSLLEMSVRQKELAFKLMEVSLSAKGLQLSKDIMKTDHTLWELNNKAPEYSEELYFFTIMGKPSMEKPWGWQIDGHHLIINYFVFGDQVVMTPTFWGGEPIITTTGKYAGNTLFQDEQNLGLEFMRSLSEEQQKKATLSKEKKRNNNQTEAFKDNVTLDYEGVPASELSSEKQAALLHLADQYISNMRDGHAKVKMSEVKEHLDRTYFAWVGQTDEDAVFYYRIHSPVVLIEFDHQNPVGVPGSPRGPSRNHIHTVVRTPNGNDYGKDLLRQHLEEHHH